MIDVFPFAGLPVAVLGLGKSGLSTARALMASGVEVAAWDDDERRRLAARAEGIPIVDLMACDLRDHTTLVISPGIPHSFPQPHPVAARARAHRLEIIGDVELLGRTQRGPAFMGITGTNGKSTTTALIGHILARAGRRVQVGGNLGTPVLELEPLGSDGIYVLELSSYQLETTFSITFDVAVLINISPDHLDRHGGMEGYVAAKRRIFHRQTSPRTAVIGVDDAWTQRILDELIEQGDQIVIPISSTRVLERGVYVEHGNLVDAIDGAPRRVSAISRAAALPGIHNWQNAAAAYAAARAIGVDSAVIVAAIESFAGLAHRQERIATIDGIAYVNDSKATNADATARALACYDTIYWIAGGRAKEGGVAALAAYFPRIRHAFLIGEAAPSFAAQLHGRVPASICGELPAALAAAHTLACSERLAGAVVLLSPACASWDQFANFEARGEAFRGLVNALPGARA